MKKYIKRYLFLVLCILWMSVIYYMSSKSGDDSSNMSHGIVDMVTDMLPFLKVIPYEILNFIIRKGAHFTEYGLFSLWIIGFLSTFVFFKNKNKGMCLISVMFCMIYAILDEVHQGFVSGRSPKVMDVCIDTCGALTFSVICLTIIFYLNKRKSPLL